MSRLFSLILLVQWIVGRISVSAWSISSKPSVSDLARRDAKGAISRRRWLQHQQQVASVAILVTTVATASTPALAAAPPTPQDLARLQRGHARVQYLLQNWDAETQVCGKIIMSDAERKQIIRTEGSGSAGCEKTPLNVQAFLGYKSTEDPLYRVDKLMVKAAPLVDPDDFEAYLETAEKYKDKADNSAMMAYTSSWGEANPNGGKEVIDEYLERTKEDVQESELYLRKILGYLKLETLPPSKNPK